MSVQVFICRLFGGRDLGVTYDNGAGTIAILGQAISISSLPSALQSQWQSAIGGASNTFNTAGSRGAFGGDNVSTVVGAILDNQATWRNSVKVALASFVQEMTSGDAGVETWNRH